MSEEIPRTRAEAVLDVWYFIRLHFLHRRLYSRARATMAIVGLVSGSAAMVEAFRDRPQLLPVLGVVVAVAGASDLVFNWAELAARHDAWRKEMADLLARNPSLEEIDAAIARRSGSVDDEIQALCVPAFNDNVRRNGHEDWVRSENIFERFMRFLA